MGSEWSCTCVCHVTFIWGQLYLVLPALTSEGYIALDIFESSVNKERFIHFLEEQLVHVRNTILLVIAYNIAGLTTHPLSWTTECHSSQQLCHSWWWWNTLHNCWRTWCVLFHITNWTLSNSYFRCQTHLPASLFTGFQSDQTVLSHN